MKLEISLDIGTEKLYSRTKYVLPGLVLSWKNIITYINNIYIYIRNITLTIYSILYCQYNFNKSFTSYELGLLVIIGKKG